MDRNISIKSFKNVIQVLLNFCGVFCLSFSFSLGLEIERNGDLFAEIELVTRGIIPRDTKAETIPLLAQYFYFYSVFAFIYNKEDNNWEPPGT